MSPPNHSKMEWQESLSQSFKAPKKPLGDQFISTKNIANSTYSLIHLLYLKSYLAWAWSIVIIIIIWHIPLEIVYLSLFFFLLLLGSSIDKERVNIPKSRSIMSWMTNSSHPLHKSLFFCTLPQLQSIKFKSPLATILLGKAFAEWWIIQRPKILWWLHWGWGWRLGGIVNSIDLQPNLSWTIHFHPVKALNS